MVRVLNLNDSVRFEEVIELLVQDLACGDVSVSAPRRLQYVAILQVR